VLLYCYWCDKVVKRYSKDLNVDGLVFCSVFCKDRYKMMKHEAEEIGDEKDKISRELILEIEGFNEKYGR